MRPNCHQQMVLSNFNLKICYPPPYVNLWFANTKKNNADISKKAIKDLDCENTFSFINIDDQVALLNETILNIMSNLIPNETMIYGDWDPPWLDKNIKKYD